MPARRSSSVAVTLTETVSVSALITGAEESAESLSRTSVDMNTPSTARKKSSMMILSFLMGFYLDNDVLYQRKDMGS